MYAFGLLISCFHDRLWAHKKNAADIKHNQGEEASKEGCYQLQMYLLTRWYLFRKEKTQQKGDKKGRFGMTSYLLMRGSICNHPLDVTEGRVLSCNFSTTETEAFYITHTISETRQINPSSSLPGSCLNFLTF